MWGETQRFSIPRMEIMGEFGRDVVWNVAPNRLLDQGAVQLEGNTGLLGADPTYAGAEQAGPQVWARFSRDGQTFGAPKYRSISILGNYDARLVFRGLGQFRKCVMELNMTDPVEVSFAATAVVDA